jgi:hypothetical protein
LGEGCHRDERIFGGGRSILTLSPPMSLFFSSFFLKQTAPPLAHKEKEGEREREREGSESKRAEDETDGNSRMWVEKDQIQSQFLTTNTTTKPFFFTAALITIITTESD